LPLAKVSLVVRPRALRPHRRRPVRPMQIKMWSRFLEDNIDIRPLLDRMSRSLMVPPELFRDSLQLATSQVNQYIFEKLVKETEEKFLRYFG
jgi:hypothetical protein